MIEEWGRGTQFRIDCAPFSGRTWEVSDTEVVDLGVIEYPLCVATVVHTDDAAPAVETPIRLTDRGEDVEVTDGESVAYVTHEQCEIVELTRW